MNMDDDDDNIYKWNALTPQTPKPFYCLILKVFLCTGCFIMVAGKVAFSAKTRTNPDQVFCNWFISMDDSTQHGIQEVIQANRELFLHEKHARVRYTLNTIDAWHLALLFLSDRIELNFVMYQELWERRGQIVMLVAYCQNQRTTWMEISSDYLNELTFRIGISKSGVTVTNFKNLNQKRCYLVQPVT